MLCVNPGHACGKVVGTEGKRSHDDGVGTGMPEARHGVVADAAISGKKNLCAGLVDHMPCLGQPAFGLRVEPDTLYPHSGPQKRQH